MSYSLVKADLGLVRSACSLLMQTVDAFAVMIAVFVFRSVVCVVKGKKREILIKGTPPLVVVGGGERGFQLMCAFARAKTRRRRLILNDIG